MIYLNDQLGPFKHLLFDMYQSNSIRDFIDSRENISDPSKWKILSPGGFFLAGNSVQINFTNVSLCFMSDDRYEISDPTGHFCIDPAEKHALKRFALPLKSARRDNLQEGRYHKLNINYYPSRDLAVLFSTDKFCYAEAAKKEDFSLPASLLKFA
jgi:hypothetical protein